MNKFEIDTKLIPRAIESRWWSVLKTAKVIRDQWQYICDFFDHLNEDNSAVINKKVQKIINLIGNDHNRHVHYLKITHLIECFSPMEDIEKQLEVSSPNSHKFYDLLNTQLKSEIQNMTKLRNDTKVLLKNFDLRTENILKPQLESLYDCFNEKWVQTMARNLDQPVFGKDGLFNKCIIFDPFMKAITNQTFEYYSNFFNIVNDKEGDIEKEFNEYLLMDSPENTNISVIGFWI
jgi:hypothetical protein